MLAQENGPPVKYILMAFPDAEEACRFLNLHRLIGVAPGLRLLDEREVTITVSVPVEDTGINGKESVFNPSKKVD